MFPNRYYTAQKITTMYTLFKVTLFTMYKTATTPWSIKTGHYIIGDNFMKR